MIKIGSLESKKYKVLNIDIDNEKNDEDIIRIKGKVTNLIDNGLITYRQDSILPLPINKNELEITFLQKVKIQVKKLT